jgi:hypothetical protein
MLRYQSLIRDAIFVIFIEAHPEPRRGSRLQSRLAPTGVVHLRAWCRQLNLPGYVHQHSS